MENDVVSSGCSDLDETDVTDTVTTTNFKFIDWNFDATSLLNQKKENLTDSESFNLITTSLSMQEKIKLEVGTCKIEETYGCNIKENVDDNMCHSQNTEIGHQKNQLARKRKKDEKHHQCESSTISFLKNSIKKRKLSPIKNEKLKERLLKRENSITFDNPPLPIPTCFHCLHLIEENVDAKSVGVINTSDLSNMSTAGYYVSNNSSDILDEGEVYKLTKEVKVEYFSPSPLADQSSNAFESEISSHERNNNGDDIKEIANIKLESVVCSTKKEGENPEIEQNNEMEGKNICEEALEMKAEFSDHSVVIIDSSSDEDSIHGINECMKIPDLGLHANSLNSSFKFISEGGKNSHVIPGSISANISNFPMSPSTSCPSRLFTENYNFSSDSDSDLPAMLNHSLSPCKKPSDDVQLRYQANTNNLPAMLNHSLSPCKEPSDDVQLRYQADTNDLPAMLNHSLSPCKKPSDDVQLRYQADTNNLPAMLNHSLSPCKKPSDDVQLRYQANTNNLPAMLNHSLSPCKKPSDDVQLRYQADTNDLPAMLNHSLSPCKKPSDDVQLRYQADTNNLPAMLNHSLSPCKKPSDDVQLRYQAYTNDLPTMLNHSLSPCKKPSDDVQLRYQADTNDLPTMLNHSLSPCKKPSDDVQLRYQADTNSFRFNLINSNHVALINVIFKYVKRNFYSYDTNTLNAYAEHKDFCMRYIDVLLDITKEKKMPLREVLEYIIIKILLQSNSLEEMLKAYNCLQLLKVRGQINYKNYPLDSSDVITLLECISEAPTQKTDRYINSFYLLRFLADLFESDFKRYVNNKKLRLAVKYFCFPTNKHGRFQTYFSYLGRFIALWTNCGESMTLEYSDEVVVIEYRELIHLMQRLLWLYIECCSDGFLESFSELYADLYSNLFIPSQKELLLSTIPNIDLKVRLLDSIVQKHFENTVEYDRPKLNLCRLVEQDFERLPPRFPYTKLDAGQERMYSADEVNHFVYIIRHLTELYVTSKRLNGSAFLDNEKNILKNMKARVESLTEGLELITAQKLTLPTRILLKGLAKISLK